MFGLALCGDGRRVSSSVATSQQSPHRSSIIEKNNSQRDASRSSYLPGTLGELLFAFTVDSSPRVFRSEAVLPRGITPSMRFGLQSVGKRISSCTKAMRSFLSSDGVRPLRATLSETKNRRGLDHPYTFVASRELALRLDELGRSDEAEAIIREVFERKKKIFGPEHPDTLESLDELTYLLNKLGRYSEAEVLMKGALQARRRVIGKYSPYTISALNDYADTLKSLDRFSEAAPLNKYVLDLSYRVLGPQHPETERAFRNFAGSDYARLQSELKAKDAIKTTIATLARTEPDWNLFADDFKVIDHTGAELQGLGHFKSMLQCLQNLCNAFNAKDQIFSQRGNGKYPTLEPFVERRWIVDLQIPIGRRTLKFEIEVDTTFHISGGKVDCLKVNAMALNGRPYKLAPKIELADSFDKSLDNIREWILDIAQLKVFEGLRLYKTLVLSR